MSGGTIEIIRGGERRRRWSIEEKVRIVGETEEAGARVTEVAVAARRISWAAVHLATAGSGWPVGCTTGRDIRACADVGDGAGCSATIQMETILIVAAHMGETG